MMITNFYRGQQDQSDRRERSAEEESNEMGAQEQHV